MRACWTLDVDGVGFPAAQGVGEPRDVGGDDPPRALNPALSPNSTSTPTHLSIVSLDHMHYWSGWTVSISRIRFLLHSFLLSISHWPEAIGCIYIEANTYDRVSAFEHRSSFINHLCPARSLCKYYLPIIQYNTATRPEHQKANVPSNNNASLMSASVARRPLKWPWKIIELVRN